MSALTKEQLRSLAPSDDREAQLARNLNLILPRIRSAGKRIFNADPCRALFVVKPDDHLADDLVFPMGSPVSRPAWYYGKDIIQQRRDKHGGHVFEFACLSNPAHVVLGKSNTVMMHILVIVHSWIGHVDLFTNNRWHAECQLESILHKFRQDETFVRTLVADNVKFGWDYYEYYDDAAHALQMHSGDFPKILDAISEADLRDQLTREQRQLENAYQLAKFEPDRDAIAGQLLDTLKLLSCHPINPSQDILGFWMDPTNNKDLSPEARMILEYTRTENRWGIQVLGRTKIIHEGWSHLADTILTNPILAPELDLMRLGMDHLIDNARYSAMHDGWPIYWYFDPYALGKEILHYIMDTYSTKVGTETITYRRLHVVTSEDLESGAKYAKPIATGEVVDRNPVFNFVEGDIAQDGFEEGDWVETFEFKQKEVDVYDHTFLRRVLKNCDDYLLFDEFLTEEFFERLHRKALKWVHLAIMQINKELKDGKWPDTLIFEDDRYPRTLEEVYLVIVQWIQQVQMAQWIAFWDVGMPPFPAGIVTLWQMLQIVQTVAAYDADKHEFKRQMRLRTSMQWVPRIHVVDTGRYNKANIVTLRHTYDPDFGPLQESHARWTLRYHWRFSGPCRLLTMEQLYDAWGRPWGPPRPYEYSTTNGSTVKERWL